MAVRVKGSGGGGSTAGPTVTIKDHAGAKDETAHTWKVPDLVGAADTTLSLTPTPTDNVGVRDSLAVTGTPTFRDNLGARDSQLLTVTEVALTNSATPDTDPWGDSWVDRLLANQGVNHGNDTLLTVSALTAVSETDGYLKIDFRRLTGFTWNGPSTLTLTGLWSVVAANPNQTLNVDFRSSSTSPWTESTVTASNRARFTSTSPYTQRTFPFALDGAAHACTVTFTQAEVNDFAGKWLEVQLTTPDLAVGTVSVTARNHATTANRVSYQLALIE